MQHCHFWLFSLWTWKFTYTDVVLMKFGNSGGLHPLSWFKFGSQGQRGSLGWVILVSKEEKKHFCCCFSVPSAVPRQLLSHLSRPGFHPGVHVRRDLLCVNVSRVFFCLHSHQRNQTKHTSRGAVMWSWGEMVKQGHGELVELQVGGWEALSNSRKQSCRAGPRKSGIIS